LLTNVLKSKKHLKIYGERGIRRIHWAKHNICLVTFIMNQLLCMLFISHEHESAHLTLYLV